MVGHGRLCDADPEVVVRDERPRIQARRAHVAIVDGAGARVEHDPAAYFCAPRRADATHRDIVEVLGGRDPKRDA